MHPAFVRKSFNIKPQSDLSDQSDLQNHRAGGFAAFKIVMGLGGIGKRIGRRDVDFDDARFQDVEQLTGRCQKLFTGGVIGEDAWAGQEIGTRRKLCQGNRRDLAR